MKNDYSTHLLNQNAPFGRKVSFPSVAVDHFSLVHSFFGLGHGLLKATSMPDRACRSPGQYTNL